MGRFIGTIGNLRAQCPNVACGHFTITQFDHRVIDFDHAEACCGPGLGAVLLRQLFDVADVPQKKTTAPVDEALVVAAAELRRLCAGVGRATS